MKRSDFSIYILTLFLCSAISRGTAAQRSVCVLMVLLLQRTHPWTSPPRAPKRPPRPLPRSPLDTNTTQLTLARATCNDVVM